MKCYISRVLDLFDARRTIFFLQPSIITYMSMTYPDNTPLIKSHSMAFWLFSTVWCFQLQSNDQVLLCSSECASPKSCNPTFLCNPMRQYFLFCIGFRYWLVCIGYLLHYGTKSTGNLKLQQNSTCCCQHCGDPFRAIMSWTSVWRSFLSAQISATMTRDHGDDGDEDRGVSGLAAN